jgi:hypothetical protein
MCAAVCRLLGVGAIGFGKQHLMMGCCGQWAGPAAISGIVQPVDSGPTRYEVGTLGVGKRVYVDEPALFTAVPRELAGVEYILTGAMLLAVLAALRFNRVREV